MNFTLGKRTLRLIGNRGQLPGYGANRNGVTSVVGKTSNSTLRRWASCLTSSITGSPVPTTRRWHFHGIFSSTDSGVWPNSSRNFFGGFLLALADLPAIDHNVVLVGTAVDLDGAEREFVEMRTLTPWLWVHALFLDVRA
jgi:hypothetical protein